MSAFVVSDAHIDAMVTMAAKHDHHCLLPSPNWAALEEAFPGAFSHPARRSGALMLNQNVAKAYPSELGRALLLANIASLRARYKRPEQQKEHDASEAEAMAYAHAPSLIEPASAIKQGQCFAYQACERDDWDSSWARKFCDQFEKTMIQALPGYEAAPWGI
jgi:hypothetical protein